jgi:hypothetical protein
VDHNADAIVQSYAPDAVIFDLAPPLGRRGMNREAVAAWLAGWEGPILIDARDVNLTSENKRAMVHCPRSLVRALLHGRELSRCG